MTTRTVTMSHSELDRFGVITRVRERRLTQIEAAWVLNLGVRQVQRLCAAVAQQGADGLVSVVSQHEQYAVTFTLAHQLDRRYACALDV
jgi:hypothetical protein